MTGGVVGDSQLCERILGEYREMPGHRLSAGQAARLWGLEAGFCEDILDRLVRAGHLSRSARGEYRACADAEWAR